jgi:hypothetical protein
MRAKQVGAVLVVGGMVGLGMLGKLVQRRHDANGQTGSSIHSTKALALSEEQADAFVSGLEAAKPPSGEEQIRRQRELYSEAAKLARPTRVRAAR